MVILRFFSQSNSFFPWYGISKQFLENFRFSHEMNLFTCRVYQSILQNDYFVNKTENIVSISAVAWSKWRWSTEYVLKWTLNKLNIRTFYLRAFNHKQNEPFSDHFIGMKFIWSFYINAITIAIAYKLRSKTITMQKYFQRLENVGTNRAVFICRCRLPSICGIAQTLLSSRSNGNENGNGNGNGKSIYHLL